MYLSKHSSIKVGVQIPTLTKAPISRTTLVLFAGASRMKRKLYTGEQIIGIFKYREVDAKVSELIRQH